MESNKRRREDGNGYENRNERVHAPSLRRIANACVACRARKTKCDGVMPSCSFCLDRSISCQYQSPAKKDSLAPVNPSGNGSPTLPILEDISSRLSGVEMQLEKLREAALPSSFAVFRGDYDESEQTVSNNYTTSSLEPLSLWWNNSVEDTLNWPAINYSGQTHTALKALIKNSDLEGHSSDVESIRAADLDVLVQVFLDEVHTKNPVLDPILLQLHVTSVKENGIGWDPGSCLVLLVCALAASSCRYEPSTLNRFFGESRHNMHSNHGRVYYSAATKRLGVLMHSNDLTSIQCQFLSGVYSMYNMQPWVAWKMFHSASVSCYGYLIREQIQDNCELESGAGSRDLADSSGQRLYWSCMKSEREIAHEFHFPVSPLTSLEYPYPLPNPPSRLGDSSNAFLTAYSPQIDTNLEGQSWYYYLTEISLRKLELEINDYFLRQSQEHTQQTPQRLGLLRSINNAVMGFDKRLFAYWQNIPPSLSFSLEDIRPCKTELEQYLRMKMMWIRHDLCRISLYMILHHDLSQSAQLHTSFTNMAKKGLSIALQFMNISVNSHRNHGTWFGFRLGVESALELIAARRSGNPELAVSEDSFAAAAKVLCDGLEYWSSESDDINEYLKILRGLDPVFTQA